MKRLLILLYFLLICIVANAKVNVLCDVQYKTKMGWSKKYRTEVTFLFGPELSPKFHSNHVYVAIWFSDETCAIVKLDTYQYIGLKMTYKDVSSIYYSDSFRDSEQINGEVDREWRISARDGLYNKLIDNRIPENPVSVY